jgi:two-component sensor histidine kinase
MLSLAIHELGDNAQRHGSLSNGTGRVSVRWAVADGQFVLTWKESGGPPVSAPPTSGYGLKIIERVLAAEFEGSAELRFNESGVVLHLEAPANGLGKEQSEWKRP